MAAKKAPAPAKRAIAKKAAVPKKTAVAKETSALRIRPIEPTDWPVIEDLFGSNGACGGCWCMFWRSPSRRDFDAIKGEAARRAFRAIVTEGRARGLLAFEGERPVGWCAIGPRTDFPHTERMRSYVADDAAEVWSVNCFFIRKDRRSQGMAGKLLAAAVEEARRAGARTLEGYPSVPKPGGSLPGAFLYKGTLSMFESAGFRIVSRRYAGSPLVRLCLSRQRSVAGREDRNPCA